MPRSRSRSRSPTRKRERRRSRSRERRHRKKRSRSRSPRYRDKGSPSRRRSPSPRKRSLSKERERHHKNDKQPQEDPIVIDVDDPQLEGLDDEQVNMMRLMGFANFDTTKGKKVDGTDVSAVNIQRKRRYRQYMNRKGGFNRPLDFIA